MIIVYYFARCVIALMQMLPLPLVARIGRFGGGLAYRLDKRHRTVTLDNLRMCFGGEKSEEEIVALAKENFCRIGKIIAARLKPLP